MEKTKKPLRDNKLYFSSSNADGASDKDSSLFRFESSNEIQVPQSMPFACYICRQPFQDRLVTKCKHYFCEHCALKHHSKNKKCFVCNKPTLGIFNTAHEIKKKIAEQK
ncbi:Zinc finger RING/FYVE/PHD-type protein [Dioscorea alata]|uniref:Zinc finger RING/FYVE/PHD-type protein n=1 Tax=Dioscorea alata TaxID=55571 RepID=A0ACB7UD23_DIOAL|nr:Zinc finger RING/FYVE/PHD-type protein [Dioscorea alata]